MKGVLYNLFKTLIRIGFFFYFRKIRMHGMDRIPAGTPVMLLPNHQNALIDPLLYAAWARGRKPYFLTRSDVFKNPVLHWVFSGLRMLPIYRIRDGRETLGRNQAIFKECARLLSRGEQVLLFPEANHNLRRQVRPLSKGFTRILSRGFKTYPGLDVLLVPVGVNYQQAAGFPDRAAFYFGTAFSAREYWTDARGELDIPALKERVFDSLTRLTTHIPTGESPESWEERLNRYEVDYLEPAKVNAFFSGGAPPGPPARERNSLAGLLWDYLFRLLNAPVWVPWRWIAKNKVPEPEFMSTFRFLFFLIAFPAYYLLLWGVLASFWGPLRAAGAVSCLLLHNLAYVKFR